MRMTYIFEWYDKLSHRIHDSSDTAVDVFVYHRKCTAEAGSGDHQSASRFLIIQ